MKLLVTVCAVASLSYAAMALDVTAKKQDPSKPAAKQEQAAKPEADKKPDPNADRPKPSAEMKKLARAIGGRWQVDEKYEVTPFTPQGGEGKGSATIHRGPGGLSLITNYVSNGSMGEVHGAGITTWSSEDKAFKQFWVDNGSPAGALWMGKWDGENLVFTGTDKNADKTNYWRETYSFNNDVFTITFDVGSSESDLKKFMTLKFTRMAKQSAGVRRHGTGMHGRPTNDNWSGPRAGLEDNTRQEARLR